jgi:hypothetical protein
MYNNYKYIDNYFGSIYKKWDDILKEKNWFTSILKFDIFT